MKVLWLGGIVLPRIANKEGIDPTYTNGWLIKVSEELKDKKNIDLVYLFDANRNLKGFTEYYTYYGLKCNTSSSRKMKKKHVYQMVDILQIEKPDIVHIWGTEYSHTLAMVEACEIVGILNRVVISIQGLVSIYALHYNAYLPEYIINKRTLRDCIKGNIKDGINEYKKRGVLEIQALKKIKHVIGRTDWDKACVWNINPSANYHFNNETLRDEFYSGIWTYSKCERYSIFCSQGHYPIKGIHLMIEAFIRVVQQYPQAKLYIGGKDYSKLPFWKQSTYGKYLKKLILENGLKDNVIFTGYLDSKEMKNRYLRSNVFVSPSSIENSPNSLGEAMLLGVPSISSRVGGVHNLLDNTKEGYLYPADEPYMLAYYITKIFDDPQLASNLSLAARKHALNTHDPNINLNSLIRIYKEIDTLGKDEIR